MIDQIIAYNKTFVERKAYQKYVTDKYPDKRLAVLSCMDTRLTELLPAALGLKNGDAKIIKNAGGLVIAPFDSAMRSMLVAIYELGVNEIMVVAHSNCGACHMSFDHFRHEMLARGITAQTLDTIDRCGFDLNQWLEGFKDTPESVRRTVETIRKHPLVPADVVVRGFIIDSHTGLLEEVIPTLAEYSFTRLCFRADVIEPLNDTDFFAVHTPEGTFKMTKADFYRVFNNVVKTKSYQQDGIYHYSKTPAKALPFLEK